MAEKNALGGDQFPLSSNEWMKSFSQVPTALFASGWKDALGFAAGLLKDQADYVTKLAECTDPAQALKCQAEFAQKSWTRCCDEGSKMFESARAKLTSALPPA
jgi:hypothetical protein